jgi:hypothetical protein
MRVRRCHQRAACCAMHIDLFNTMVHQPTTVHLGLMASIPNSLPTLLHTLTSQSACVFLSLLHSIAPCVLCIWQGPSAKNLLGSCCPPAHSGMPCPQDMQQHQHLGSVVQLLYGWPGSVQGMARAHCPTSRAQPVRHQLLSPPAGVSASAGRL